MTNDNKRGKKRKLSKNQPLKRTKKKIRNADIKWIEGWRKMLTLLDCFENSLLFKSIDSKQTL